MLLTELLQKIKIKNITLTNLKRINRVVLANNYNYYNKLLTLLIILIEEGVH